MQLISDTFHPTHPLTTIYGPRELFELHCTAAVHDDASINTFITRCAHHGIKVLDFVNGVDSVSRHTMTSVKCYSKAQLAFARAKIYRIAALLGTTIIRDKVETQPTGPYDSVSENQYFEIHVDIRTSNPQEVPFDPAIWNISRNIRRAVSPKGESYTLTARSKNCTLQEFKRKYESDMRRFAIWFDFSKGPFIEKCISDTNQALDDDWVTAPTTA